MGLLEPEILYFLDIIHGQGIKGKKLAMMGKQTIFIDIHTFINTITEMGIDYNPLLAEVVVDQYQKNSIDSFDFFKMLGFEEVHAIDYSDYEGADIIFDLNKPLPSNLSQSFDYIINGGTLEHIFDIATAMKNMSSMLCENGIIMHIAPSEGWPNHGFYSLSPTFFEDFYLANKFALLQLKLEIVMSFPPDRKKTPPVCFSNDLRAFHSEIDLYNYIYSFLCHEHFYKAMTICFAQRRGKLTDDMKYPLQETWRNVYAGLNKTNTFYGIQFQKAARDIKSFKGKQALYGCGNVCNSLINALYICEGEDSVADILDGDANKAGTVYRGFNICYPTKNKIKNFNRIIITSTEYEEEIFHVLLKMGFSAEHIVRISTFV